MDYNCLPKRNSIEKLQKFRLWRVDQYSITRHEPPMKQVSGYGNFRFQISIFEFLYLNFHIRWISIPICWISIFVGFEKYTETVNWFELVRWKFSQIRINSNQNCPLNENSIVRLYLVILKLPKSQNFRLRRADHLLTSATW